MKFWFSTLIVLCTLSMYRLDIPVHCTKSQVAGVWDFKATAPRVKTGGMEREQKLKHTYKETCGHPNPSHESSAYKYNMDKSLFIEDFSVEFKKDFSAEFSSMQGNKKVRMRIQYNQ